MKIPLGGFEDTLDFAVTSFVFFPRFSGGRFDRLGRKSSQRGISFLIPLPVRWREATD